MEVKIRVVMWNRHGENFRRTQILEWERRKEGQRRILQQTAVELIITWSWFRLQSTDMLLLQRIGNFSSDFHDSLDMVVVLSYCQLTCSFLPSCSRPTRAGTSIAASGSSGSICAHQRRRSLSRSRRRPQWPLVPVQLHLAVTSRRALPHVAIWPVYAAQ
jgi:hypothetical protein